MSDDADLPDLRYLRELAKMFRQYELDEVEIETAERRILLRRGAGGEVVAVPTPPAPRVVAAPAAAPEPAVAPPPARAAAKDDAGTFITSPFVGTFYGSPRPDAEAFVRAGDTIAEGQTVCIIEAMKLFNEIEAEFACVIEEILVDNAQPVEYGAKLFRVRRL
jgi:acetyl-CoA carboxylase biotin carboxyl carrier protein